MSSSVFDYDAIRKRIRELGIEPLGDKPPGSENGVDVEKKPVVPVTETSYYDYGC